VFCGACPRVYMSRFQVEDVLPPDRIPSVDDPEYATEYVGDADDEVIVVNLDSALARAYPVRYLHYHEIVNSEVDGTPVAVTWCPLCASAVVYDRRVTVDGEETTLDFGVSGKLANDDLVMYDRQTESHWKQSLGTAIDGPLEGIQLTVVPGPVTTWESFRETHPDGEVLAPPGGASEAASDDDDPVPIDYEEDPYESYWDGEGFGLAARRGRESREWPREDLAPKTPVLGVKHGGEAVGFARPVVTGDADGAGADDDREASDDDSDDRGVVTATVGGLSVVVFATADGMNAFADPGYEWEVTAAGFRARADRGSVLYDGVTGEPIDAGDGTAMGTDDAEPLERVPAQRLFAFTWQDDNGPDAFYGL